MPDVLFDTVERYHDGLPWGRVLDAGTGVSSVKWLMKLDTCTSWTAITADERMKATVMADSGVNLREEDKLVVGNWMDEVSVVPFTYACNATVYCHCQESNSPHTLPAILSVSPSLPLSRLPPSLPL